MVLLFPVNGLSFKMNISQIEEEPLFRDSNWMEYAFSRLFMILADRAWPCIIESTKVAKTKNI
jgi:hypothetical protein